jgi:hypothetical protein
MKRWELKSLLFKAICITVKDKVVAIMEDILVLATVTATITDTEIVDTPKTILITGAEDLATVLSRASISGIM